MKAVTCNEAGSGKMIVGRIIDVDGNVFSKEDRELDVNEFYVSCIVSDIGNVETRIFSVDTKGATPNRILMTDMVREYQMIAKIESIIYEAERLFVHANKNRGEE